MLDYEASHRFLDMDSMVGLEIAIISHNIELAVGMAEHIIKEIANYCGVTYPLCIREEYVDDMWKLYDMNDKELESYVSFITGISDLEKANDCVEYLMKKRLL